MNIHNRDSPTVDVSDYACGPDSISLPIGVTKKMNRKKANAGDKVGKEQ